MGLGMGREGKRTSEHSPSSKFVTTPLPVVLVVVVFNKYHTNCYSPLTYIHLPGIHILLTLFLYYHLNYADGNDDDDD